MEHTAIKDNEYYVTKYIESMSDKDKEAYMIAKKHLGSSFDIEKSIGFKKFMKTIK